MMDLKKKKIKKNKKIIKEKSSAILGWAQPKETDAWA